MTPNNNNPSTSPSPAEVMAVLTRMSARADEVMRLLNAEPQASAQRPNPGRPKP